MKVPTRVGVLIKHVVGWNDAENRDWLVGWFFDFKSYLLLN